MDHRPQDTISDTNHACRYPAPPSSDTRPASDSGSSLPNVRRHGVSSNNDGMTIMAATSNTNNEDATKPPTHKSNDNPPAEQADMQPPHLSPRAHLQHHAALRTSRPILPTSRDRTRDILPSIAHPQQHVHAQPTSTTTPAVAGAAPAPAAGPSSHLTSTHMSSNMAHRMYPSHDLTLGDKNPLPLPPIPEQTPPTSTSHCAAALEAPTSQAHPANFSLPFTPPEPIHSSRPLPQVLPHLSHADQQHPSSENLQIRQYPPQTHQLYASNNYQQAHHRPPQRPQTTPPFSQQLPSMITLSNSLSPHFAHLASPPMLTPSQPSPHPLPLPPLPRLNNAGPPSLPSSRSLLDQKAEDSVAGMVHAASDDTLQAQLQMREETGNSSITEAKSHVAAHSAAKAPLCETDTQTLLRSTSRVSHAQHTAIDLCQISSDRLRPSSPSPPIPLALHPNPPASSELFGQSAVSQVPSMLPVSRSVPVSRGLAGSDCQVPPQPVLPHESITSRSLTIPGPVARSRSSKDSSSPSSLSEPLGRQPQTQEPAQAQISQLSASQTFAEPPQVHSSQSEEPLSKSRTGVPARPDSLRGVQPNISHKLGNWASSDLMNRPRDYGGQVCQITPESDKCTLLAAHHSAGVTSTPVNLALHSGADWKASADFIHPDPQSCSPSEDQHASNCETILRHPSSPKHAVSTGLDLACVDPSSKDAQATSRGGWTAAHACRDHEEGCAEAPSHKGTPRVQADLAKTGSGRCGSLHDSKDGPVQTKSGVLPDVGFMSKPSISQDCEMTQCGQDMPQLTSLEEVIEKQKHSMVSNYHRPIQDTNLPKQQPRGLSKQQKHKSASRNQVLRTPVNHKESQINPGVHVLKAANAVDSVLPKSLQHPVSEPDRCRVPRSHHAQCSEESSEIPVKLTSAKTSEPKLHPPTSASKNRHSYSQRQQYDKISSHEDIRGSKEYLSGKGRTSKESHHEPNEETTSAKSKVPICPKAIKSHNRADTTGISTPVETTTCSNGPRQLKVEDALSYLEQVRVNFDGQLVYNQFLDIMKDFKTHSIDTSEVIQRVLHLFRGHKALILGFNMFLPPGYKIEVREDQETGLLSADFSGPVDVGDFPAHPKTVESRPIPLAPSQASAAVQSANLNQADPTRRVRSVESATLEETRRSPVASVASDAKKTAVTKLSRIDTKVDARRNFALPTHNSRRLTTEDSPSQMKKKQKQNLIADNDKNVSTTDDLDNACSLLDGKDVASFVGDNDYGSSNPLAREESDFAKVLALMHRLKQCVTPDEYEKFVSTLDMLRKKPVAPQVIANTLEDLLGSENNSILKDFLEQIPALAKYHGSEALDVQSHSTGTRSESIVREALEQVDEPKRDLKNPVAVEMVCVQAEAQLDLARFFDDVKSQLIRTSSKTYLDFLKCVGLFTHEVISREELESIVMELFQDHENLRVTFLRHLRTLNVDAENAVNVPDSSASSAMPLAVHNDEASAKMMQCRMLMYLSKPISEIAAESDIAGTLSYKKLPNDYPSLVSSGRSLLEKRTLNDIWVSVTSGSEDYSKFMRRNHFEDNLSRCEDDRYELDLVIETNAATILKLDQIASTIAMLPFSVKKRHFLADGALSPVNFNAIQRIYGDAGPDIVQQIKLNPSVAVPVVLRRLREKDICWRRARSEMNLIWREVAERNYHRSLDHRSGHFKLVDKKELSSKSLLNDILDPSGSHTARQAEMTRARGYSLPCGAGSANDMSPAAKAVALLASLGSTTSAPSLELPYHDVGIHSIIINLVDVALDGFMVSRDDQHHSSDESVIPDFKCFVKDFFGASAVDDGIFNSSEDNGPSAVFYGDDNTYIMFRHYHLLYERLAAGKKLASDVAADQRFRNERNLCSQSLDVSDVIAVDPESSIVTSRSELFATGGFSRFETAPSDLTRDFLMQGAESSRFRINSGIVERDQLFAEYIQALHDLLNGLIDSSKYEDRCRVLLGPRSYCLMTMDKTVGKLIKQVQAVFGNDHVASEYVNLFHKFCAKKHSHVQNGSCSGSEEMYAIAASAILKQRPSSGGRLFRMQCIRRRTSYDQLVIHVVGESCSDREQMKREQDMEKIDRFLGFHAGLGNVCCVAEDESSFSAPIDIAESPEQGEDSAVEAEVDNHVGGRDCRDRRTSGRGDAESLGLRGERKRPVRDEIAGLVVRKRHKTAKPNKRPERTGKEETMDASVLNKRCDFLQFAGSPSRAEDERMYVHNELEYRIGSNGRMCFIDGKADVLVYFGKKRKRREM